MLSVALANHIAEEINEMCNLADAIEKQGIEQGIEQAALANARKFFENGASYELVRNSIDALSDEVLQKIYEEVSKN